LAFDARVLGEPDHRLAAAPYLVQQAVVAEVSVGGTRDFRSHGAAHYPGRRGMSRAQRRGQRPCSESVTRPPSARSRISRSAVFGRRTIVNVIVSWWPIV